MRPIEKSGSREIALGTMVLAGLLMTGQGEVSAQGWPSYGHDPQHSLKAGGASQLPQKVRWSTSVDLSLVNNTGSIYIHYGSPVITRMNTVLVPVKTTGAGNYRVEAHSASTGQTLWTSTSDYVLPSHDWVPIFGITLTPKDHYIVYPGTGGTIYARTFPDSTSGVTSQFAFYNTSMNYYAMNPAAFNSSIRICTPISSDAAGNLFFGYVTDGSALPGYPNGLPSGLAKISSTGVGSFIPASGPIGIVADTNITKVAYNCAPAFSADGKTVYLAVNNGNGLGYLAGVDTATLTPKYAAILLDPSNGQHAYVDDDGSPTPTIGPDGDVYYGVLAYNISDNHYRGYLLHFDAMLATSKLPGAFGWDDTASIVPASIVPSYTGTSSYLLLTKYNDYVEGGGTGVNKVAIVDPFTPTVEPISGINAMTPVISVAGVTADSEFPNKPGAVREWCINSAAIDLINQCAVVNSEDGSVYRWDFIKNQLSPGLMLEPSTSEAYTPTVIGPDGAVYAINNAVLFCCTAK